VDATDGIIEFSSFTSAGSLGEVSGAVLHLDARHGWLLTRGRPALGAGFDPQGADATARGHPIDQFSLCRLSVGRGSSAYSRYLEVRDMRPQSNERGLSVIVDFACLERNLKDVLIPGHWWFYDYSEVLDAIIAHYNSQKGTAQPTLSLDRGSSIGLGFPTRTPVNFYAGTSCYDAINQLIDRLRQPVEAGGLSDYVSAYYTDGADHTSIVLHIVRQGDRGTATPTIEWGGGKVAEVIRTRLPSAATHTIVRGRAGAGTMPMHFARAASMREEFAEAPGWESGVAYGRGSLVAHGASSGPHYALKRWRAKRDVAASSTPPAEGADWEERTEWAHIGQHMQAWARFARAARDAGGQWDRTPRTMAVDLNSASYPDSNLVIRDLGYWQDWAHHTATSSTLEAGQPEGTRVLVRGAAPTAHVDGTPTGLTAGQVTTEADAGEVGDLVGNADNSLIQVDQGGKWFVARRFPALPAGTAGTNSYSVAVIQEGRIYEWSREYSTVAADARWWPYAAYGHGELVERTATAADVAAADGLTLGTKYVYRARTRIAGVVDTVTFAALDPPPQDASRWELVGAYDDLGEDERPVATTRRGDFWERRSRASATWSWEDVSGDGITPNHCFHYPHSVENVPSLYRTPDGAPQAGADTALRTIYRWEWLEEGLAVDARDEARAVVGRLVAPSAGPYERIWSTLGIALDGALEAAQQVWRAASAAVRQFLQDYIGTKNLGWWTVLFEAPMPNDGSAYQPHVLDLNNRNVTPSGNMGWASAVDSEDLGRITGLRFMLRFDKRIVNPRFDTDPEAGGYRILARGNIPFRCWVVDTESRVWHQDFTYRLLGTNQQVQLDFANFSALHSRAPVNAGNIYINTVLPEVRTVEGFNPRKIKMVGLHLLDNYDEHGRYWPWFNPWNNLFEFGGRLIVGSAVDSIGTVDGFCFIKAPVAIAVQAPGENSAPPSRTIMAPITERPNISNYVQLKGAATALAELNAWRLDNYTVRLPGRSDILAESSIILHHRGMITEGDVSGTPNTLKLVVTRVSHSVTADFRSWFTELTCYRRIRR